MDPPPASAVQSNLNYPDSVGSSPRSWDDSAAARIRLMCSFGGHIVPRPHDKSLCYVGGETRIFVADRQTSLADLSGRLSKVLLKGRPFTLKYQLPNEDLDSLISVTTDEDLDNMVDEYDRIANSPKPSRLRLFLFPSKPILENSVKSENWFLNALNGAGLMNREFPDSASVNCLLGLDNEPISNDPNTPIAARADGEASQVRSLANSKSSKQGQDAHSVPDSPMPETSSSSFGSTSSSPPIRVHVEDGGGMRLGIEEQFAQIGVGAGLKQDALSPPPPVPTTLTMSSGLVASEFVNRVVSDDERSERSEHGVPAGYRKPPAQQIQAQSQKPSGGIGSASPDSVSSSIANALSRAKPAIYQEDLVHLPSMTSRVSANPDDPNTRIQMQQVIQDPGYALQHQFDPQQQQFIHPGPHYIQHHPGPVPGYYPVYPSQQVDQQYPVYYMPARPGQASARPQTLPNPAIVQQPPPAYAAVRNPPIAKPEMSVGMYRSGTPAVVQAHSGQQQFVDFSQMQYPPHSVAPTTSAPAKYGYDTPIYYTQPLAHTMSYTMGGAAALVLPDGYPNDAIKQQQVRT